MSIKTTKQPNKITAHASMLVIDRNAFKVMLYDIYDDLMAQRARGVWFSISVSILGAGVSGLVNWLFEDVFASTNLKTFQWLSLKSGIYGAITLLALISLFFHLVTIHWAAKRGKVRFVKKYYSHESLTPLDQPLQLTSTAIRNPSTSGTSLNSDDSVTENERPA